MKKFNLSEQAVGIAALVTAVVAVVIGIAEMQVNREYARLSVEPYIDLYNSNAEGYSFNIRNSGLGPARVKGVQVKVDGKVMQYWDQVATAITGVASDNVTVGVSDTWVGLQIQAGDVVKAVNINDEDYARKVHENSSKFSYAMCYCSIYDECWVKDKNNPPVPVDECPPYLRAGF